MKQNLIQTRTFDFAVDIINLYKQMVEKNEYVLSKQLLRSGTSIGANVNEAICAESKKDFVHKLSIALKEARETKYWINILKDSDYLSQDLFDYLNNLSTEIIKILSSIILTTKQKYLKD